MIQKSYEENISIYMYKYSECAEKDVLNFHLMIDKYSMVAKHFKKHSSKEIMYLNTFNPLQS